MNTLQNIVDFMDTLLELKNFPSDPSANGLQVRGDENFGNVVFGVDACEALFAEAIERKARLVVVHHGLIWGGGLRSISGVLAGRMKTLLSHNISLYACHLPLDAHPIIGNNAQLANVLKLNSRTPFFEYARAPIGVMGMLPKAMTVSQLQRRYDTFLGEKSQCFGKNRLCKRVAIVSGGAGPSGVDAAIECGADVLITGAFEHEAYHLVKESNLSVIALGHYLSEQCGLQALMEQLEDKFDLHCEFVTLPTGL